MGNLRRRPNYMLFNHVHDDDIVVNAGGNGVFIKNYGIILADWVMAGFKCCYCEGIPKEILITVHPNYPCDDCQDWEGGFDLMRDFHLTGRAEDFYGLEKPFYYKINKNKLIVSTTGYLDPADTELAVANIVNDIGVNNMENLHFVDAFQQIRYDYTAGVITLVINDVGSAYTVTYTGATIALLVTDINTDADKRVRVWYANAHHIILEGLAGFGWTAVLTNLTREDDQDTAWIRLTATSSMFTFDVNNYDGFGTVTVISAGEKPKVHPDDVARVFPALLGVIGQHNCHLPICHDHYCVYKFVIIHPVAYDHSFANHLNMYYEEAYFYVRDHGDNIADWDAILNEAAIMDGSLFVDSCSCPSASYHSYSVYDSSSDSGPR
jgi:hypothetical protein